MLRADQANNLEFPPNFSANFFEISVEIQYVLCSICSGVKDYLEKYLGEMGGWLGRMCGWPSSQPHVFDWLGAAPPAEPATRSAPEFPTTF